MQSLPRLLLSVFAAAGFVNLVEARAQAEVVRSVRSGPWSDRGTWEDGKAGLRRLDPATGRVLATLEMPEGEGVSGLEGKGDFLFCGGIKRPTRHQTRRAGLRFANRTLRQLMKQRLALVAARVDLEHLAAQLPEAAEPLAKICGQLRLNFAPQPLRYSGTFTCRRNGKLQIAAAHH